jgi:hypothetical protein
MFGAVQLFDYEAAVLRPPQGSWGASFGFCLRHDGLSGHRHGLENSCCTALAVLSSFIYVGWWALLNGGVESLAPVLLFCTVKGKPVSRFKRNEVRVVVNDNVPYDTVMVRAEAPVLETLPVENQVFIKGGNVDQG